MAYTYLVQNVITGQFYIGSRSKSSEGDLWVRYFTSSSFVKDLIREHGKSTFVSEVLFESDDYDECYWLEQKLIKETIKDALSLNKHYIDPLTGKGKFATRGPKTETTRQKMREAKRRYFEVEANKTAHRQRIQQLFKDGKITKNITTAYRQKLSIALVGVMANPAARDNIRRKRLVYIEAHRDVVVGRLVALNKARAGVPLSPDHKLHISEGSKGRETSAQARENLSKALKGKPKSEVAKQAFRDGWIKRKAEGRDGNNPFKEKVACPHCGKTGQATSMKRWHFANCRLTEARASR